MKIKSIKIEKFKGTVYNFRCDPDHNYFSENVLVHNCDVPKVKFQGNVSFDDLKKQLYNAISLFSDKVKYTERLNIHFARMGEPIFNYDVQLFAKWLYQNKKTLEKETNLKIEVIHPVLTTSLPRKFNKLKENILSWCSIKNDIYNGQAGLQLSINSTSEEQRSKMFGNEQLRLEDLSTITDEMPEPISRKYCLNFAYASGNELDAKKLSYLFDKEKFMIKITPIHNNNACRTNKIETINGYDSYEPYQRIEEPLLKEGFDVLTFVPSLDEEDGLVTCGNAILGGSELKTESDLIKIEGM